MPEFLAPLDVARRTEWVVACLCAAWCTNCRDYRAVFQAVATATPWARLAWVDIEDESDWLGDIEVQNFPTLLIACGSQVQFFGPMLPHASQLQRVLDHAREAPRAQEGLAPVVLDLAERLASSH